MNSDVLKICRTCLQQLTNAQFQFVDSVEHITRNKLLKCVPELNLEVTPNSVICEECSHAVETAYKFKKRCIEIEEKIQKYMNEKDCVSSVVDLSQLVHRNKRLDNNDIQSKCIEADRENYIHGEKPRNPVTCKLEPIDVDNDEEHVVSFVKDIKQEQVHEDQNFEFCDIGTDPPITDLLKMEEESEGNNLSDLMEEVASENALNATSSSNRIEYICKKCPFKTFYKLALLSHRRTHRYQPYQCSQCDFKCSNKTEYNKHIKTHNYSRPLKCPKCNCDAKTPFWLYNHMRLSHPETYKCDLCSFESKNEKKIKSHKQSHMVKNFNCPYCDHKSISISLLKVHKLVHEHFKCPKCDFKNISKEKVDNHYKSMHPYQCNLCDFDTRCQLRLLNHKRRKHKKDVNADHEDKTWYKMFMETPVSEEKTHNKAQFDTALEKPVAITRRKSI